MKQSIHYHYSICQECAHSTFQPLNIAYFSSSTLPKHYSSEVSALLSDSCVDIIRLLLPQLLWIKIRWSQEDGTPLLGHPADRKQWHQWQQNLASQIEAPFSVGCNWVGDEVELFARRWRGECQTRISLFYVFQILFWVQLELI